MTIRRDDYAVVPLKSLNGIYEEISTNKMPIKSTAQRLANKHDQVMVVIQVLHVFVPQETSCEEEGCKNKAVLHYCEEHAE